MVNFISFFYYENKLLYRDTGESKKKLFYKKKYLKKFIE